MLLLDFYFRGVKHHELLKDHHVYPWYVIVHHEALIAWCQWLWRTITISSGRQLPLNSSDCSTQTIRAHAQRLSFSPLVCRLKKLVRGLIPLDVGTSLKSQFHSLEHLICSAMFQKRLWCHNFKPLASHTELSRSHQNVYVRCFATSTDDARGSAHRAVH